MYSRVLAERVRILKETPEGVEHMCKEMDKLYNEGVEFGKEQGIAIGERSMKREIVLSRIRCRKRVYNFLRTGILFWILIHYPESADKEEADK